jgi:hypothetical protein
MTRSLALTIARQLGFAIERLQAEEAKELLLGESRHRIKNVIATVQALTSQTLAQDGPHQKEAFVAWRTKSNTVIVISANPFASHSPACRKSVHDYRRDFSGVTDSGWRPHASGRGMARLA